MQRAGSVYVVTNNSTGEQYVGLTRKTVQKRWEAHKRTAQSQKAKHYRLHTALQRYGSDVFSVRELFVAFDDTALCSAEIQLIADHQPLYNSALGGAGFRAKTFSAEYRAKRSEAAKARWADPAWKAKTVLALRAPRNSAAAQEQARTTSRLRSGSKTSEDTKARIAVAIKAKHACLVTANAEKARMIHAECSAGANVKTTCNKHGMSKKTFYTYVKRLQLPLFGQRQRSHRCDLQ